MLLNLFVGVQARHDFLTYVTMRDAGQITPAGRMVTSEDIARVVAFLCTEDAAMIRGQVIVVDGGFTLLA